jgi:predicted phosphodiesterase/ribosomal protein S27AE|tara:strand:+ start:113 stop:1339 length:1227 start_codon:yes stop_codon:yes gene_type:complete
MIIYNDDGYIVSCPKCGSGNLIKHGLNDASKPKLRWKCNECNYKTVSPVLGEPDIIKESVKLAKQKQSFQDRNRIERKTFREFARLDNAVNTISSKILAVLRENKFHKSVKSHPKKGKAVGMVHFSDLHFNELVRLPNNKFDFGVASKRIKRHIEAAKSYFSTQHISNVVVALTGDLINSDRRLDEMLTNSTNRAQAVFIATDILQQAILDLNKSYNVTVACVSGNEARVHKEYGWTDILATDNYDFTIFNMLRALFMGTKINFVSGDPMEVVINVAGQNVLLLHGHGSITAKHESSVNQIKGRYASRGIHIDYVISGHIHSARIGDTYARSSSLVGANDYSEKALNLSGRASQNLYIFYNNGNRDGIKVDLQHTDNKGYNIDKSLEAYNPKSRQKLSQKTTILEIKI